VAFASKYREANNRYLTEVAKNKPNMETIKERKKNSFARF
jgi:hypothetical protein